MTRKTSPKSASSTPSNIPPMLSLLLEDFQTTYASTMVARGHLTVMLDCLDSSTMKPIAMKLMDLNHQIDQMLSESESILRDYLATRG
jgi:hypothetical protein